jgi:hypothetical protein
MHIYRLVYFMMHISHTVLMTMRCSEDLRKCSYIIERAKEDLRDGLIKGLICVFTLGRIKCIEWKGKRQIMGV